jgi:hypothetical protein
MDIGGWKIRNMDLREIRKGGLNWIDLAQNRDH